MSEDRPTPDSPWREIAKEVSTECGSDKVAELSHELIAALDKQSPHAPERDKEQVRRKPATTSMVQSASSADWRHLYEAALLESDANKRAERITTARSAILDRIDESFTHPLPGEHHVLGEALRDLRRLAEMAIFKQAA